MSEMESSMLLQCVDRGKGGGALSAAVFGEREGEGQWVHLGFLGLGFIHITLECTYKETYINVYEP